MPFFIVLKREPKIPSMLYIHIPYCASKCAYCDFYSRPMRQPGEAAAYVDALLREWQLRSSELPGTPSTLYLGGGTPSLLPPAQLDRLFAALPLGAAEELTLEANPEQLTPDFFAWLASTPINRLSVGVQSLSDAELRAVGRRHTARQALDAVDRIVGSPITNFSLDLIYGLPGQSRESWLASLGALLAVSPPHLSCYMLSYEPGTRLDAMRRAGRVAPTSDDLLADMYADLCGAARAAGYDHYEISNFALPGRQAIHNSGYWTLRPYLGLGASAHSFDGRVRRYNPSDLREYLAMGSSPVYIEEPYSPTARHNDLLLCALRTSAGLPLAPYEAQYGPAALVRLRKLAAPYVARGAATLSPTHLRLTEPGFLLSDALLSDLIEVD